MNYKDPIEVAFAAILFSSAAFLLACAYNIAFR